MKKAIFLACMLAIIGCDSAEDMTTAESVKADEISFIEIPKVHSEHECLMYKSRRIANVKIVDIVKDDDYYRQSDVFIRGFEWQKGEPLEVYAIITGIDSKCIKKGAVIYNSIKKHNIPQQLNDREQEKFDKFVKTGAIIFDETRDTEQGRIRYKTYFVTGWETGTTQHKGRTVKVYTVSPAEAADYYDKKGIKYCMCY